MPERRRPDLSTVAVEAGRPDRIPDAPLNTPMTAASTYVGVPEVGGGERGYGRYGNPGWEACEQAIGALEGGRARTFATGMAAVTAVVDLVPAGGVLVIPDVCYLGVGALADRRAERTGMTVRRVDVTDTAAVLAAADGADLVWLESPTNPAMQVADLPALGRGLRGRVRTAVDNTFATALRQRPLDLGFDLVVLSGTKLLAGHSDALLGAVVTRPDDPDTLTALTATRTLEGAVPGTLESFLTLRGIRTLAVRLDRAEASAAELVRRLEGRPGVEVRYPGFGSMLSLVLPDAPHADAVVAAVELCVHATSLGGVETMLERRRRWPGELAQVPEGLVRVSVGIEHVDDLWADLDRALTRAGL